MITLTVGQAPPPGYVLRESGDDLEEGGVLEASGCTSDLRRCVQVVSLGSYCGVKLGIRSFGLGEASLPFDWIRTRIDGVNHWLTFGFGSFFSVQQSFDLSQNGRAFKVYRSNVHSFWHDTIDDDAIRDKLWRRVQRFEKLCDDVESSILPRPLLFVRSLATSAEIGQVDELHQLLQGRFGCKGRPVFLLAIIGYQEIVLPILHKRNTRLMFWMHSPSQVTNSDTPYEAAISFAIKYFITEPKLAQLPWYRVKETKEIFGCNAQSRLKVFKQFDTGLWAGSALLQDHTSECDFAGIDNNFGFRPRKERAL